jgi:CxxC-x17-CxxC domain-containing protein
MNDFRFKSRPRGGRESFRRDAGGRDGGRPPLHDAVCDECGKDCKVPFRPSGDKPIYCSDCFEQKGGRDGGRSRGGRDSGGYSPRTVSDPNMGKLNANIEILNSKLDKLISLLSAKVAEEKPKLKNKVKKKKVAK